MLCGRSRACAKWSASSSRPVRLRDTASRRAAGRNARALLTRRRDRRCTTGPPGTTRSAARGRHDAALPIYADRVVSPSGALAGAAVQAHGVAVLVYQLDAIDSARATRSAADFVHQFEQHPGIELRGRAQARLHAKMQDCESFMRRAYENGNAYWSPEFGYREQGLHSGDIPDADTQATVLFVDLRHSIGFYGLLDADAHPMLVDVEEQQLLQRGARVHRQF